MGHGEDEAWSKEEHLVERQGGEEIDMERNARISLLNLRVWVKEQK